MDQAYADTIHEICQGGGIPELSERLANAGVAGKTLENAIARNRGAPDLVAAVLADQGVASRLAYSEGADQTSQSSPRKTPPGNHGWDEAFRRAHQEG